MKFSAPKNLLFNKPRQSFEDVSNIFVVHRK